MVDAAEGSAAAGGGDAGLEAVAAWLRSQAGDLRSFFAPLVRQSINEVLDGPRTGRWGFEQLEKTEKTYVGTKVEIVTRTALKLEHAGLMDLEIAGHPVDVKWSMSSRWEIPREAVGHLCLCIGGRANLSLFQVGLIRCIESHLKTKGNQDGKRTLSPEGRAAMLWLVEPTPIPPNFVAEMAPEIRRVVMSEPTIQKRVTRLFLELPRTPIPRDAIRTVAQTEGDPMRRVRADAHAGDPLRGYKVLSAKYANPIAEALGYPRLKRDEFMSVPAFEVQRLQSSGL